MGNKNKNTIEMKKFIIETEEFFNGDVLAYLVENMDMYATTVLKKASKWNHDPVGQPKRYLDASENQKIKVSYKQNDSEGRMVAVKSLSLQTMARPVRHAIAEGVYIDVDIVCCHQVILAQLCKKNNVPCPHLIEYVVNRCKYIDGPNRSKLKQQYLKLTNGGRIGTFKSTEHMRNYEIEMFRIPKPKKSKKEIPIITQER